MQSFKEYEQTRRLYEETVKSLAQSGIDPEEFVEGLGRVGGGVLGGIAGGMASPVLGPAAPVVGAIGGSNLGGKIDNWAAGNQQVGFGKLYKNAQVAVNHLLKAMQQHSPALQNSPVAKNHMITRKNLTTIAGYLNKAVAEKKPEALDKIISQKPAAQKGTPMQPNPFAAAQNAATMVHQKPNVPQKGFVGWMKDRWNDASNFINKHPIASQAAALGGVALGGMSQGWGNGEDQSYVNKDAVGSDNSFDMPQQQQNANSFNSPPRQQPDSDQSFDSPRQQSNSPGNMRSRS